MQVPAWIKPGVWGQPTPRLDEVIFTGTGSTKT
jgi:hypothetical protein